MWNNSACSFVSFQTNLACFLLGWVTISGAYQNEVEGVRSMSNRCWPEGLSAGMCNNVRCAWWHYNYDILSAMASQITSLAFVFLPFIQGTDQTKLQSSAALALCEWNSPLTGEFLAQMASNAENVSIWWRHHGGMRNAYDGYMFLHTWQVATDTRCILYWSLFYAPHSLD